MYEDPHRRKALRLVGKMSRDKGKVGEREVAALLREHGFDGKRGVQYKGGVGSADVEGLPGFHPEVKRVEKFNLYKAMDQADADRDPAATPIVFHRSNSREWVVVMKASDFFSKFGGFI